MKKFIAGIASIALLFLFAFPVLAAGKSAPKATGSYEYNIYGLDRHADFNAISTAIGCDYSWNVTGNYTIDLTVNGAPYTEYLVLQQIEENITGVSLALNPAQTVSKWTIDSGTVIGNDVVINAYWSTNTAMKIQMIGTIAINGSISGSWQDVIWNTRSGDWSTTAGLVTKVPSDGCTGKGTFNYSDANGTYYTVDVKYVSVEENSAWFAGPVVSGNWAILISGFS